MSTIASSTPLNLVHIIDKVKDLHSGVKYGAGQFMIDQVLRCQELAKETKDPALEIVALLHKSQEEKRISPTKKVLTDVEIISLVANTTNLDTANKVSAALKYLKTEPRDPEKPTKLQEKDHEFMQQYKQEISAYHSKTLPEWAAKAPKLVQGMLLIEKIVNFEASIDVLQKLKENPKADFTKKDPAWHLNYFIERMQVVETVQNAYPELYSRAQSVFKEGTQMAKPMIEKKIVTDEIIKPNFLQDLLANKQKESCVRKI